MKVFQIKILFAINNNWYELKGSVREISKLAPNNVNTMAIGKKVNFFILKNLFQLKIGALCAQNLGFDYVKACLIADSR